MNLNESCGNLLSKLILYTYFLQKHVNENDMLAKQFVHLKKVIENQICNIETSLIEFETFRSRSIDDLSNDMDVVWDHTYSVVLPQLILNQLSRM